MLFKHIPNIISFSRIIATPFFVLFMFKNTFFYKLLSLMLFFVASVSDILDGYIARKYNFVTNFGRYIDPIADKILILSAFFLLYSFFPVSVKLWMVLLIFFRDIIVTIFRFIMINNNIVMQTSNYAKWKTVFQIITIHVILIFHTFELKNNSQNFIEGVIYLLMVLCVCLTILTAAHYFFINIKLLNDK